MKSAIRRVPSRKRYSHIVAGAGTAGSLVANRLATDKFSGRGVLLLEAGQSDQVPWVTVPAGYLVCIGNPAADWMFKTVPEEGLNGRQLKYPRGKVLGGCSSINGMIYMRGQSRDYDSWAAEVGDESWKWDNVLQYFKNHESHWNVRQLEAAVAAAPADKKAEAMAALAAAKQYHSASGELMVQEQRFKSWDILEQFIEAAGERGVPQTSDFNQGCNMGIGYFEVNQKDGTRFNSSRAFIHPLTNGEKQGHLEVVTGAKVVKLLFDEATKTSPKKCYGMVVQLQDGSTTEVECDSHCVLSCGAINTPNLMMHSGIGCPETLSDAGIEIRHILPGVGKNLQDHLQIRTIFKVHDTTTLNTQMRTVGGVLGAGWNYLRHKTGPLSMAPSQVGAFWPSTDVTDAPAPPTPLPPHHGHPDLEFHIQPLSLPAFGEMLHPFDAMTVSVCNLNPTSRGVVLPSPYGSPVGEPHIQPRYLSTDRDKDVAVKAITLAREIMNQPAMAKFSPEEFLPGPSLKTHEELVKGAGDIGTTIFHPSGTCKMGKGDDAMAVVDSQLRVRGIENLVIADTSVMPTITSGNTNAPTLMIAERAADFILSQMK